MQINEKILEMGSSGPTHLHRVHVHASDPKTSPFLTAVFFPRCVVAELTDVPLINFTAALIKRNDQARNLHPHLYVCSLAQLNCRWFINVLIRCISAPKQGHEGHEYFYFILVVINISVLQSSPSGDVRINLNLTAGNINWTHYVHFISHLTLNVL